jgi:hypothetical protein
LAVTLLLAGCRFGSHAQATIRTSRSASWSVHAGIRGRHHRAVLGNRMGQILGKQIVWRTGPAPPRTWLPNSSLARQRTVHAVLPDPPTSPMRDQSQHVFRHCQGFAPVALVNAVTGHPGGASVLAVNTVQELIAYAKSKPAS